MSRPSVTDRTPWWHWPATLSLDAPLVAVLWQLLFARKIGAPLDWHDPLLLGLAVWVIYAADRWIEGWRLDPDSVQTRRHGFYIRHRWPVCALGVAALVSGLGVAVVRLEEREFKAGVIVTALTLLYLFSHQLVHRRSRLRVPKEIVIAVIFAAGCALAPAAAAPDRIPGLAAPAVLFGLLCFADCALIASWERDADARHGQTSLALQLKQRRGLIRALPWATGAAALIPFFAGPDTPHPGAACTAASGLLLGALDLLQPRIGRENARALVDFTLMTPVALFFFR